MLQRKESMRESYARRQREKWKAKAKEIVAEKLGRKTPLKKIAKSRRRQMAEYLELRIAFLARPENWECGICKARVAHGEARTIRMATECHHVRGRAGNLITWEPGLLASCADCRDFPHSNPKRARAMGILASPAEWNTFPRG